jgi:hypothetical protein
MKPSKLKFVCLLLTWSLAGATIDLFYSLNGLVLFIVFLAAYNCCMVLSYSVTDNPTEQAERNLSQSNVFTFNQYVLNIIRALKKRAKCFVRSALHDVRGQCQ